MRVFVIILLVASAAAQYEYNAHQRDAPLASNNGDVMRGEALLSEPIQPFNEYNKQFFSYTAPESEFEDNDASDQLARLLKTPLNIVFIKGPDNTGFENAALRLAKSASDAQTAIYLLNKQADISSLTNKFNAIRSRNTNKPEIRFVKYRTLADAENAQRTIHSQYESLPGSSTNSDTVDAPVLDFSSKTV